MLLKLRGSVKKDAESDVPGIFKETNSTKIKREPAVEIEGGKLYVEPFGIGGGGGRNSQRRRRRVISTSFFIFPERVKKFDEYRDRIVDFMNGLEKGLEGMSAYDGWEYVIYLDYSVYMTHGAKDVELITTLAKGRIDELTQKYANFTRVGVRFVSEREVGSEASTFLPSVWRFLPMIDPTVELFTSIDLDNPPSSLIMHLGRQWYERPDRAADDNRLFISMDFYYPMQCMLYVARHLNLDGSDAPRNHVYCPIAQFWFWARAPTGKAQFEHMLSLMNDTQLVAYFSMPYSWIFNEFNDLVVHSPEFQRTMRRKGDATIDDLERVIATALHALEERKKTPGVPEKKIRDWAGLVRASPMLTKMLTLTLFGRITGPLAKNLPYQRMAAVLSVVEVFEDMRKLISNAGYGIDEYVMNALMNPPRSDDARQTSKTTTTKPAIITTTAKEAGFRSEKGRSVVLRGDPPMSVKYLMAITRNDCRTIVSNPQGAHQARAIECIVRTAAFLMFLRPHNSSSHESKAWYAELSSNYKQRVRYLTDEEDPVRLLMESNYGYVKAAMIDMLELDRPKFTQWCQSLGITCQKDLGLVYGTDRRESMETLKEAVLKKLFLNWAILTLPACIHKDHIRAFNMVPW